MEKKSSGDKFLKIVLAGIVVPFMLLFILIMMPFYFLGLLFNWIFKLELL
jgi:hypothetical protein